MELPSLSFPLCPTVIKLVVVIVYRMVVVGNREMPIFVYVGKMETWQCAVRRRKAAVEEEDFKSP